MSSKVMVAPSVLSADFTKLASELDSISDADYIHFDVMDGSFVPNISFGPAILSAVKRASNIPVDCHLMIDNPEGMIDAFIAAKPEIITFHLEATRHAHRLIKYIQSCGVKAGVVLNPQTPVCMLEDLIEDVDMVLIMSVNPGFGGQSFIPNALKKLREVKVICDAHDVSPLIEIDGGVSDKNAAEVVAAGANVLVAGSAVFKQEDRNAAIASIKEAANK